MLKNTYYIKHILAIPDENINAAELLPKTVGLPHLPTIKSWRETFAPDRDSINTLAHANVYTANLLPKKDFSKEYHDDYQQLKDMDKQIKKNFADEVTKIKNSIDMYFKKMIADTSPQRIICKPDFTSNEIYLYKVLQHFIYYAQQNKNPFAADQMSEVWYDMQAGMSLVDTAFVDNCSDFVFERYYFV